MEGNGINVSGVLKIILSWVISPVLSGLFSLIIYSSLKYFVFNRENSVERTIYIFPIITFLTFLISTFFIIYKGTPQLNLDKISFWKASVISISVSFL